MTTGKTKEPTSTDKIRFYDCDPFGHLNNSRYIDYIMNAREIHLASYYGIDLSKYYQQGTAWVVNAHEIQFLRPAQFNETVCIQTSLIAVNDTKVQVEGILFDEMKKNIKAVLWTSFTCINLKTGRTQKQDPELMQFYLEVLNTSVDPAAGLTARVKRLLTEQRN